METVVDSSLAADLRLVIGRLARRMRQDGAKRELTASRLSARVSVDRLAPVRRVAVAAAEAVPPPSLGRTVASVEEAGLIARTADADDRRAARITLTPAGRGRIRRIRRERTAWLQRRLDALSADELAALADAVPVLTALSRDEGAW